MLLQPLVLVAVTVVIVDAFGTKIVKSARSWPSRSGIPPRGSECIITQHATPHQRCRTSCTPLFAKDDNNRPKGTSSARSTRHGAQALEEAVGKGRGKHAGSTRRKHSNKYKQHSTGDDLDPWEAQLQAAEAHKKLSEESERAEIEEMERRRMQRRVEREERGELMVYPDEEDIDPYDPSTFGYIEVGHVQGAHGIKGEIKVRSVTDFAAKRLCTPGVKYMKAPNRRTPRDVELRSGRWQKEDVFLITLEGIKSRDAAAALRGHKMYVLEDEDVDLEENEYLVRDIVGARAYRADDESVYLGDVVGIVLGDDLSTSGVASDSLELRLPTEGPGILPKVCYVPFVPAFVPVVNVHEEDSDKGPYILLDLPDGLLDLAVEVVEKTKIKGFLPGRSSTARQ